MRNEEKNMRMIKKNLFQIYERSLLLFRYLDDSVFWGYFKEIIGMILYALL